MDDRRLVARARGGDVDAYDQLVRANQSIAFHTAYAITRDASEAEDATQEAFVKAYFALRYFKSGAPFRPWFLRIVTNEALNRVRTARRRGDLASRAATLDDERWRGSHSAEPEAAMLATERREFVLRALSDLEESDRIVLTYRYLLDLSVKEIAEIVDIPDRTVRSRLSRALARLRDRVVSQSEEVAESPYPGERQ